MKLRAEEFILCDTGFIVGIADEDDRYHREAAYFFEATPHRFLLPISVLVEAFHELRKRKLDSYLHNLV
ncbi:MAG: hypothetical protein ACKVQS_06205, partial [Fimbriimonadaceae bacterium]